MDLDVHKHGRTGKPVTSVGEMDVPVARHDAGHREGVGPYEVILVQTRILVHYSYPQQCHLRKHYYECEGFLPLWVEP